MALRELAATFSAQCRDSLIRDQIVTGTRDPSVMKKLCAVPHLTLATAVDVCRAEEVAQRDVTAIVGQDEAAADVRRVTGAASRRRAVAIGRRCRRVPSGSRGRPAGASLRAAASTGAERRVPQDDRSGSAPRAATTAASV